MVNHYYTLDTFVNQWDLVFVSVILFVAFLFFIPFRRKTDWKAHGTYTAFIIALFAEMFGFPLTIYFISSFFTHLRFPHQFLQYMNVLGMPIGLVITVVGLLFIVAGWKLIYRKSQRQELVTDGIYAYVRHPQYFGLIMVTMGWLVHWPTIPTAVMWPILVVMYYRLAKREEKDMEKIFGERYMHYKMRVPMLFPRIKPRQK